MARGNFGERLKRERELREVTLKEITSATRIGPRFLEALENEEWEKLPGGVFNRGFVRSVARYLGLDEESFLAEYDLAHGPVIPHVTDRPAARHFSSRPKWIPFVAFFVVALVLLGMVTGGIYAWRYYAARRAAKQSPASFIPAPSKELPIHPPNEKFLITAATSTAVLLELNARPCRGSEHTAPQVQLLEVVKT